VGMETTQRWATKFDGRTWWRLEVLPPTASAAKQAAARTSTAASSFVSDNADAPQATLPLVRDEGAGRLQLAVLGTAHPCPGPRATSQRGMLLEEVVARQRGSSTSQRLLQPRSNCKARATSRHGPIQLRRLERGLEVSRAIKVKRGWCQGIGFVSGRHGCSEPGLVRGQSSTRVTMRCTQDMNQIGLRARQLLAVGAGGRRSSRRHGHLCHARPMPASQQKARRTWPPAAPEHEQEEWEADAPATAGRRRA